jgi:hypothetical protein
VSPPDGTARGRPAFSEAVQARSATLMMMRSKTLRRLARRARLGALVVPLIGMACGQTSNDGHGVTRAQGGKGGEAGASTAAGSGTFAGNPSSGSAGRYLPDETEEDRRLLGPLFSTSNLEELHGEALLELAGRVALARGYAMCRCFSAWAKEPPETRSERLLGCAEEESGMLGLANRKDGARCLSEALAADPTLEATVRCEIPKEKSYGRAWLEACWHEELVEQQAVPPSPWVGMPPCPGTEPFGAVWGRCQLVHYCPDGARIDHGGLCDTKADCADASDEHACFERGGADMFQCGDEITYARDVCRPLGCGQRLAAAWCDEMQPDLFRCDDGKKVAITAVCDRVDDCADRTDERYCLR